MIADWQKEIMYRGEITRGRLVADSEECAKIDEQLKENPDDYYLWAARGIVCATPQEAVESYSMALAIRPLAPNMLYNRGRRYMGLNQYKQSLADLNAACLLDPEDGWKWHFRGVALYFLGKYREAAESFQKAIETGQKFGLHLLPFDLDWMWNALGKLGEKKRMAECIKVFTPDTPVLDTELSYKRRLLLYNGYMTVEEFLEGIDYEDHVETANQLYGLANYYFYIKDDPANSVKYLKEALTYTNGKASWGYKMAALDLPGREDVLRSKQ
jgi:tetratricopeptide (TPR) repeat protein